MRFILWLMIKIWFIILVNSPCILEKYGYSAVLSKCSIYVSQRLLIDYVLQISVFADFLSSGSIGC